MDFEVKLWIMKEELKECVKNCILYMQWKEAEKENMFFASNRGAFRTAATAEIVIRN